MSRIIIVLLLSLTIFSADTIAHQLDCNRENEEYQCGSACQTTCSNLGEVCPIVNIRCNDACYCKEGFARIDNDNSRCIPIRRQTN
ncbi:Inducible metalloproteinase inhibitor protein-like [Camponotus japonicus]